ncbi:uncharacterized protein LOC135378799 [Ornithodoros turicata]|uniref:uncharacterized protein LOC135378799 n=1 Tax=Ornithodoros turicata TaxID=34597 RepID=UPI003138AABF
MFQLVVFLTACCFVATVHAAAANCKSGPFSAAVSLGGPGGSGVYKLMQSTFPQEEQCVYIGPPQTTPTKESPATYYWGWKKDNKWEKRTGTVYPDGASIMDHDDVYGNTNTTLVYTEKGKCDVTLFHGQSNKLEGGPFVELWQHTEAEGGSNEVECCQKHFKEELTRQGKTLTDATNRSNGCDPYPELK